MQLCSSANIIYEDKLDNYNCIKKGDGSHGTSQQQPRYFLAGKQVCMIFYMRAQGVHNDALFRMETDALNLSRRTYIIIWLRRRKKHEILVWLLTVVCKF